MEQYNDNEWKIDKYGKRYREVGNHVIEYEMMVRVDGMEIPQSQLEEYNRRTKESAEARRVAEKQAHQKYFGSCPFSSAYSTSCKPGCTFYTEDGCRLAVHPGQPTEGKKCPFNNRVCNGECAMFKNGCTLPTV